MMSCDGLTPAQYDRIRANLDRLMPEIRERDDLSGLGLSCKAALALPHANPVFRTWHSLLLRTVYDELRARGIREEATR